MKKIQSSDISYPYEEKIEREEYEKIKQSLQIELLKLQHWMRQEGKRLIVLFEGRDAAGKGKPSSALWSI